MSFGKLGLFSLILSFILFISSCSQTFEQEKPVVQMDYSGKYVLYEYNEPIEIQKNPDQTYTGTYSNINVFAQIDGNEMKLFNFSNGVVDTTSGAGHYKVEGKELSQIYRGKWYPNVGEKIKDSEVWDALQLYKKNDYRQSETVFRKFIQKNPDDLYIHSLLVDCLIQENKISEARSELTKIEKNPNTKSNPLNLWLVPRVRYCLKGKEKYPSGENHL